MFYEIVDVFPIEKSISFFNQEDSEFKIAMLGGMTDTIRKMSSDLWDQQFLTWQSTCTNCMNLNMICTVTYIYMFVIY